MPSLSEESGANRQLRRVFDLEQLCQICHRCGRGKEKGDCCHVGGPAAADCPWAPAAGSTGERGRST